MTLVARTSGPPQAATSLLREAVRAADPGEPTFDEKSLDAVRRDTFGRSRAVAYLIGAFATLALVLSAIGVYGVIAYLTTARSREIGIRMALGASRGNVVRMVIGDAMKLVLSGIAIGVIAAPLAMRLAGAWVLGLNGSHTFAIAAVAALLGAVCAGAAALPARRAANAAAVSFQIGPASAGLGVRFRIGRPRADPCGPGADTRVRPYNPDSETLLAQGPPRPPPRRATRLIGTTSDKGRMLRRLLKAAGIGLAALIVTGLALYAAGLRFVLDGGGTPYLAFVRSERARPNRSPGIASRSGHRRQAPHPPRRRRRNPQKWRRRRIAAAGPLSARPERAPYWTDFRGPRRDGHYDERRF